MFKTFIFAASASIALGSTALAQSKPIIFGVPTSNGGAMVGGQFKGNAGMITHQPLGSGYTNNGLQFGTRGGTTFGGNVTTTPSGAVIGGGATMGWTFK